MKKFLYPLIYPRIYSSDKQKGIDVIKSGQITMSKITKNLKKVLQNILVQNTQ